MLLAGIYYSVYMDSLLKISEMAAITVIFMGTGINQLPLA